MTVYQTKTGQLSHHLPCSRRYRSSLEYDNALIVHDSLLTLLKVFSSFFFELHNSNGITWGSCCHRNSLRCEAAMTTASQCCDGDVSLSLNFYEKYLMLIVLQFKIPTIYIIYFKLSDGFWSLSWHLYVNRDVMLFQRNPGSKTKCKWFIFFIKLLNILIYFLNALSSFMHI